MSSVMTILPVGAESFHADRQRDRQNKGWTVAAFRNFANTPKQKSALFVNNQIDAQFFFMYIYFYSLHVSGSHVPIIRRINCINTTSGICHSV